MSSQVDLHMHSTVSDGIDTPFQLAEKVRAANIRIFAITDHDTVMGAERLKDYPSDGLIFIHGIEFSCRMDSGKCHILGYGCDASHPEFHAVLEEGAARRRAKLERRLVLLRERGIQIPDEELKQLRQIQSVGKPHLANLMVRLGYARDRKDAIENIINPCRSESSHIQAGTVVQAIAVAGGIPVWAHPLGGEGEKDISPEQFSIMLDELIGYGLLGIECFYSKYPLNRCEELAQTAQSRGLLVSGGSDYHGTNKSIALGTLNADEATISLERLTILQALNEKGKFT